MGKPIKAERRPRPNKKVMSDMDINKIERLSGLGLNYGDIAHVFGMSRDTFWRRMKENPDIQLALDRGRAVSKQNLLAKGVLKAIGKQPNDPRSGDNDMLKFMLARVHGLSEKQILEHKRGIEEDDMTIEQLKERIEELEERNQCVKIQTMQNLKEID